MIGSNIQTAKRFLDEGKLVALPTETVYGLAAKAIDANAVRRIFEAKNRPQTNPLILHFGERKLVNFYVSAFPLRLKQLADAFWPGPLTLLLPKSDQVIDIVNAGKDEVAVRIPNHPMTLQVLKELNYPVAAPSANPFGYISPTQASHVDEQLGDRVNYILDGGNCENGIESTIVGIRNNQINIFRLGAITADEISNVTGEVVSLHNSSSDPLAPGMLPYHYAPRTPIMIEEEWKERWSETHLGIIHHSWAKADEMKHSIRLSTGNRWKSAGSRLYQSMYDLDQKKLEGIIIQRFPNEGLGPTLNDRLKRAATPKHNG